VTYTLHPLTTPFNEATHLSLRLSPNLYAGATAIFGHVRQLASDHYHHNFTVSQV